MPPIGLPRPERVASDGFATWLEAKLDAAATGDPGPAGLRRLRTAATVAIYIDTLSWRTPTTPLPMEINPRVVFERLFGDGGTPEERLARIQQNRSVLDAVTQQAKRLNLRLGAPDRNALNDYQENVREVKRRLARSSTQQASPETSMPAPLGIPESFEEHIKLMFDLQVLAYQADLTRVSTFMLARQLSQRTYPAVKAFDPHHSVSHHQDDPV